jgi:hypothetical protein
MNSPRTVQWMSMLIAVELAVPCVVQAAYVTPMRGGGQLTPAPPMIHCDVMFDGTNITLGFQVAEADIPLLRPLVSPDQFDPAQPWAVLQNKAYNYQYAWNPGGLISLPTGTGIWVERMSQDNGLETYVRPPASTSWPAVFTQDGERWKWGGSMQHNAYAVLNPTQDHYRVTYRVYIAEAATGVPIAGYGSATVTWTFHTTPVPEPVSLAMLGSGAICLLTIRRR